MTYTWDRICFLLAQFFSAYKKTTDKLVIELERKVSKFYGCRMMLVAIRMDGWLCNSKELDDVYLYWEPMEINSE